MHKCTIIYNVAGYTFSTDYVSAFANSWILCLRELIGRAGVKMLEVGSFEGRSAIWFLENILTGPGCSLTCVDRFTSPYGETFERNIAESGRSAQVVKLAGNSRSVLPSLADSAFDVVYIDGGHREREVREDALHAWRLAKSGAFIIFDDYGWRPELPPEDRPARAIDGFLLEHAGACRIIQRGYQVIVRKHQAAAAG